MGKYFGTDGFRGVAGRELTAYHAFRMGLAIGTYCKQMRRDDKDKVRAVIGKDTRRSSYMLEYAIAAGLSASGADAYILHVCTTPCVSYVTASESFDAGIMISASHNPFYDNGIKVIGSGGEKLTDLATDLLEELMERDDLPMAEGEEIGRIVDHYSGRNRYIGYLISLSRHSFKGCRIGLDCANGAAFSVAASVFAALGAEVHAIGCEPSGTNINDGVGSTHPEKLSELIRKEKLDFGFAFDGDADRCIAADERGSIVDGDDILYILAKGMKESGELHGETVVTTLMSNTGLYTALEKTGIAHTEVSVGDKYVWERMKECGYSLGGEASGHIIISKYATTGDGILTAIKLTERIIESEKPLSALHAPVVKLPQLTLNLPTRNKAKATSAEVLAAREDAEKSLRGEGRVTVRASGTEPLIRITVEAKSQEVCEKIANG